jgi:hypothetical protein
VPEANRSEKGLDSKWFTRRATWSGLVFALAAVLTSLNLFPPNELYYLVRSEVVVSASRLPQLKSLLEQNRATASSKSTEHSVSLIDLQVLDHTAKMIPGPIDVQQRVALVAMNSRWRDRCTPPTHRQWLKSVTRLDEKELDSSDIARQHRFAKWALATAKHYAERHAFLASREPAATTSDGKSFQLATGSRAPVALAAYGSFPPAQGQLSEEQEQKLLLEQVQKRQQLLEETERVWREKVDRAHGLVRIATQPQISVRSTAIPAWLLSSILSLGIFAGAIAAWFQYRLQSGGVYEPASVANQLALQGLPVVGALSVPATSVELDDWLERSTTFAASVSRRAARNMTMLSEIVIGGWLMLLAIRLVLDPLWRTLLLDNPLVAFSRLLLGMP